MKEGLVAAKVFGQENELLRSSGMSWSSRSASAAAYQSLMLIVCVFNRWGFSVGLLLVYRTAIDALADPRTSVRADKRVRR